MNNLLKPFSGFLFVLLFISCASDRTSSLRNAAVAVWDFDNLTPSAVQYDDLGELLSSQVIAVLQEKGDHALVERDRLRLALEELQLGTAQLVDESTRLKLGSISGARLMVFGAYQVIGNQMRLDLRMVEVETGKVVRAAQNVSSASDISGWLAGAREAAGQLF